MFSYSNEGYSQSSSSSASRHPPTPWRTCGQRSTIAATFRTSSRRDRALRSRPQPIMTFAVEGKRAGAAQPHALAEEDISRRLQSIPRRQRHCGRRRASLVQVLLLTACACALGVSPDMVVAALERETPTCPRAAMQRVARRRPRAREGDASRGRRTSRTSSCSCAAARACGCRKVARVEVAGRRARRGSFEGRAVSVEIR